MRGPSSKKKRVLLMVCGALVREVQAICAPYLPFLSLEITALPAILHNHPEKITPAFQEKLKNYTLSHYHHIFVGYGDCGTQGYLQKACEILREEGIPISMMESPHCYSFFRTDFLFQEDTEKSCTLFYLTDFLAAHFKNFVIEPLGLEKHPSLREIYFAHYTGVCYYAQAPTPELREKAQEAADFLKLPLTVVETGYGDLRTILEAIFETALLPSS